MDASKIAPADEKWGEYYQEDRPYNSFSLGQFDESKHPYLKKLPGTERYLLPISKDIESLLKDGDLFVQFNIVPEKPSAYNIKSHLQKGQLHAALVFFDAQNKPFVIQSPADYRATIHSGPYHLLRLNDKYPDRDQVIAKMKQTAMRMRQVGYKYDGGLSTDVYHRGKVAEPNALPNLLGGGQEDLNAIRERGCQAICRDLEGGKCPAMYCSELVYTILAIGGINIHPETLGQMFTRIDSEILKGLTESEKRSIRSTALKQFFSNISVAAVSNSQDQSLYETYVNLPDPMRQVIDQQRGPIFFPHDFLDDARQKDGSLCYAGTYVGQVFASGGVMQNFANGRVQNSPEHIDTISGHSEFVLGVSFSPDGKKVITGSGDGTAKIWDSSTGALLKSLEGHSSSVESASFSPDGKKVITGSGDGTAKIWDSSTGALIKTLGGHSGYVFSASFSPDGKKVITGSNDKTAKIWDSSTGALLKTLEGHSGYVVSASFSPDGKKVITGSWDKTAKIWDSSTGALLKTLAGHSDDVQSASFSPDGKKVITGSLDKTAKIFDSSTGALLKTLPTAGDIGFVKSASFSPDGKKVLTGSSDGTAKIWDSSTGALIKTLEGHSQGVKSASFSPDGKKVLTGSYDRTAKIFAADSVKEALQRYLSTYGAELGQGREPAHLNQEFQVLVTAGKTNAGLTREVIEGMVRTYVVGVDLDELLRIATRSFE